MKEQQRINIIKQDILKEIRGEFPDWNLITSLANEAAKPEDDADCGYTKQFSANELALFDIGLSENGYEFILGELDWHLGQSKLSPDLKLKIKGIKEDQRI